MFLKVLLRDLELLLDGLINLRHLILFESLGGPTDDQTFSVGRGRFGNDVEMDMVDLLVGDATVVLCRQATNR